MRSNTYKINEQITSEQIRLIGDNVIPGVYSLKDALVIAGDNDLIEISNKDGNSVCRVDKYDKFIYNLGKKEKVQKTPPLKEIKLGPNISDNDISHKMKNASKFLLDGHKVKLTVVFSGRDVIYPEKGRAILSKFKSELSSISKLYSDIEIQGKKMSLTLMKL